MVVLYCWQDKHDTCAAMFDGTMSDAKVSKKTLAAVEARHKKQPDATFLGNAMYLHAAILIVNKQRKKALVLMDKAIAVDSGNQNLVPAKKNWVKGNK